MAPFVWHQRILLVALRLEFIRAFIILYFFNYKAELESSMLSYILS